MAWPADYAVRWWTARDLAWEVPNNQFWHRQRPGLYLDAIGQLPGLACLPTQPATPFTRGVFT